MAMWNGIDFVPKIDGVEMVCDSIDFSPEVEKDERKPTNSATPVTHYIGKRMKVDLKGGIEGQAIGGAGTAAVFTLELRAGSPLVTTLPTDIQDVINDVYEDWCWADVKVSGKAGPMEYDCSLMSGTGTFLS